MTFPQVLLWSYPRYKRHAHMGNLPGAPKSTPGLEAVDGEMERSVLQTSEVYKECSPRPEITQAVRLCSRRVT